MRARFQLISMLALAACRGGSASLETRTFDLRQMDAGRAEQLVKPYVVTGSLSMAPGALTIRETRDNLDRIAAMLTEHDRAPAPVKLTFQVIRANGAAPPDSAIAAIEQELRQLFRFRGYALVAQGFTTGVDGAPILLHMDGPGGPYQLRGRIENVGTSDTGSVRLGLGFSAGPRPVLETLVTMRIGQTMVLGGQSGSGSGAIILAVRPERP